MSYVTRIPAAYRLTHKPSGYYYVGSSSHYKARLSQHKSRLSTGTHVNRRLQSVFTNWDDMHIEVFDVLDLHEARELEQQLLDKHHGSRLCCNVGSSSTDGTSGIISLEMRRANIWKSADARRGTTLSDETKARMSRSHTGVARSDDAKLSISLGKSRKVSVNGVVYDSAYALAKELGISVRTVRTRIYSESKSFKDWFFIEQHPS